MWHHLDKILPGHPGRLVPHDLIALIDSAWEQNRGGTAAGEIVQQIVPGRASGLAHPRQVLHTDHRACQATRIEHLVFPVLDIAQQVRVCHVGLRRIAG